MVTLTFAAKGKFVLTCLISRDTMRMAPADWSPASYRTANVLVVNVVSPGTNLCLKRPKPSRK